MKNIRGRLRHRYSGQPSHGGDRNTSEVMTSTQPKGTLGSVASLVAIKSPLPKKQKKKQQQQQTNKKIKTTIFLFFKTRFKKANMWIYGI